MSNEQLILAMWNDWLHRVRDEKVVWTSSSPDLAGLLEEAGYERRLASEAVVALHA